MTYKNQGEFLFLSPESGRRRANPAYAPGTGDPNNFFPKLRQLRSKARQDTHNQYLLPLLLQTIAHPPSATKDREVHALFDNEITESNLEARF
jgi:hypothetical protein